jgi:N utilization substance protein A
VAEVIVPDYQLSLAIGKEGQNARLAARLTGWRVDIKSESQLADEEAGIFPAGEDEVEYAEGEWVRNETTGELEWHSAEGDVVTAGEWAGDADGEPVGDAVVGDVAVGEVAVGEAPPAEPVNVLVDGPVAHDEAAPEAAANLEEPGNDG